MGGQKSTGETGSEVREVRRYLANTTQAGISGSGCAQAFVLAAPEQVWLSGVGDLVGQRIIGQ